MDEGYEKIVSFLYENLNGFLATSYENRPYVRPFQFMMEEDRKIYFCTATKKDVYTHLLANPVISFATSKPDFSENLRINGNIKFIKNSEISQKILKNHDLIQKIYKTADNPEFRVFYMETGVGIFWNYSSNMEVIKF